MTRAKTTYVLFALAVLLTCWFGLFERKNLGRELEPGRLFFRLLRENINRIEINKKSKEKIVLARVDANMWQLLSPVKYRVELGAIDTMLRAIVFLKAKVVVNKEAEGAFPASGARITLTFLAAGKERTIIIGNRHLSDELVYYRIGKKTFLADENLKVFCERSVDDWRDKGVCPVKPEVAEFIEISSANNNKIVCERSKKNIWFIKSPEKVRGNPAVINNLVNAFNELAVQRFYRDDGKASLEKFGLEHPRWRVRMRALGEHMDHEILVGNEIGDKDPHEVYLKRNDSPQVFLCEDTISNFLGMKPEEFRDMRVLPFKDYGWVKEISCRGEGADYSIIRARKDDDWTLINHITGRETRSPKERGGQLVDSCYNLTIGKFLPGKNIGAERFRVTINIAGISEPMVLIFGDEVRENVFLGRRKGIEGEPDVPFQFFSRLLYDATETEIFEDPKRGEISREKLLAFRLRTKKGSWLLTRLNNWRVEGHPEVKIDQQIIKKAVDLICKPTAVFYETKHGPLKDLGLTAPYSRLRLAIPKSLGKYSYYELLVGKQVDSKKAFSYMKLDTDYAVFIADPTPLFDLSDNIATQEKEQ